MGFEGVGFAVAVVVTVGRFVEVGAERIAEVEAEGVGPEGGVDDFDVLLGDGIWVVAVLGEVAFFERVVHGIDSNLAAFVASHGVDVGLLDEEEYKK